MLKFKPNVDKALLKNDLYNRLLTLSQNCVIDIVITSGYRSLTENKKVGGVPNSSHLNGSACDIWVRNDAERFLIVQSALKVGFERIGVAPDHVHIDIDTTKNQKRLWIEK